MAENSKVKSWVSILRFSIVLSFIIYSGSRNDLFLASYFNYTLIFVAINFLLIFYVFYRAIKLLKKETLLKNKVFLEIVTMLLINSTLTILILFQI